MAYLVLVRHGLSEYNKKGLWTGWDNPPLAPEGIEEAKKAGEKLTSITFNYAFTSLLTRAQQTLEEIKKQLHQENLETIENGHLNERNYGDFTGKNKWQVKLQIGDEEFEKIRRSWDYPIPNGESLKQVYEREIPYFQSQILPKLEQGKNVLLVSSGNAIRAIIKFLEHIPNNHIASLEIGTGEVLLYELDPHGRILHKEIRSVNHNKV